MFPALLLVALGCGAGDASEECEAISAQQCETEPDGGTPTDAMLIVDTAWLEEHLGDPDLQLVDTRATGYDASRIPGAIHLRPGDLATTRDGISSQIAPPSGAEPVLRGAGLRNDVIAVVYGSPPEYDPSRVVWALRYYRHGDVRYLDGGFAAWVDVGGDLETDPPSTEPSDYVIAGVDEDLRVTGDSVLSALGEAPYEMPTIQLVDARSEGEYEAGRIPTARSVNWTRNLAAGFLRSDAELEALYDGLDPEQTTVTYCVTGWRGSFDWLTLTALGYEDVRLYDGSWNEWSAGAFPVEQ